jgi:hypothetical protein
LLSFEFSRRGIAPARRPLPKPPVPEGLDVFFVLADVDWLIARYSQHRVPGTAYPPFWEWTERTAWRLLEDKRPFEAINRDLGLTPQQISECAWLSRAHLLNSRSADQPGPGNSS